MEYVEVTIHVTNENIDKGRRNSDYTNPVSLSFRDAGYPGVHIGFNNGKTIAYIPGYTRRVHIPNWVNNVMDAYDEGWFVTPFSFKVTMPVIHYCANCMPNASNYAVPEVAVGRYSVRREEQFTDMWLCSKCSLMEEACIEHDVQDTTLYNGHRVVLS